MKKNCLLLLLFLLGFTANTSIFQLQAASAAENKTQLTAVNTADSKKSVKDPAAAKQIQYFWHQGNLERHFRKHRAEFPEYKTAAEYGNAALKFFKTPPKGTEFKRRSNGDRLFYYEKENLFGVTTKNGAVKTFFRPDSGRRYWKRQ